MIIGTRVGGGPNGLGYGGPLPGGDFTLTKDVDFKCDRGLCYSTGRAHDMFRVLQSQINRFANVGATKFTPLKVDGYIGKATVAALVLAMRDAPLGAGFALDPGYDVTMEKAASLAPNLAARLGAVADMMGAAAVVPVSADSSIVATTQNTGTPSSPPGLPTPTPQPAPPPPVPGTTAQGQSNVVWWVIGGLAGLAVVGLITATVIRAKRRKAASPSFAAPYFGNPDIFPFPY